MFMGYPVDLFHQRSTTIKSNSMLSTNTVVEDIYRDNLPSIESVLEMPIDGCSMKLKKTFLIMSM
jgi:hypothetical protein